MENQVTTIEQSPRLVALGVPAEKASMVWFRRKISPTKWGDWELILGNGMSITRTESNEVAPAYTVADLLEMMPKDIPDAGEQNHGYHLTLFNCFFWNLCYENHRTHRRIGEYLDFDLIALLCNRIEWLLSNGYKLEV